jgi:2'-phosphotransferase
MSTRGAPRGRGRGSGGSSGSGGGRGGSKLRGNPARDSPDVQLSKTLSYLLRHGAEKEKLPIRDDGYVRVRDLVRMNSSIRVGAH